MHVPRKKLDGIVRCVSHAPQPFSAWLAPFPDLINDFLTARFIQLRAPSGSGAAQLIRFVQLR
jgi:hypothetical protein